MDLQATARASNQFNEIKVFDKLNYLLRIMKKVSLFAGVLSKHGITKGDRVLIYMPQIPQAIVAMVFIGKLKF